MDLQHNSTRQTQDLQQLNQFYNYCLDVYDATCDGFYWNETVPMSMQEIQTAYRQYKTTYPELNNLDTTTRQICKDFVLTQRGHENTGR